MSETPPALVVPSRFGPAAAESLSLVPWERLHHAFGRGTVSDRLSGSVEATLRAFASDDPETASAGAHELGSNVCHQGTIYEATAYAVPFIAAIAAGEERMTPRLRSALSFLAAIAHASSFETDGGSMGSRGPGVGPATHAALRSSDAAFVAIAARVPPSRRFIAALRTFAKMKTIWRGDASRVLKLVEQIEKADA